MNDDRLPSSKLPLVDSEKMEVDLWVLGFSRERKLGGVRGCGYEGMFESLGE